METRTIAVLEGDETGQELLEEAVRALAADVVGFELDLPRFDLSLASRRATGKGVVHEGSAATSSSAPGAASPASCLSPASTIPSPSCAWRWATRTGRRSGGRELART